MMPELRQALSHVLWIGGATDAGKSSVAQKLAERYGLQLYPYDRRDLAHHQQLAKTDPAYRDFLALSMDERWVIPEPEDLFQRTLQSFRDRFPLVLADLMALPRDAGIVAEGFGLLPEFLAPLLSQLARALWLVPTDDFKLASMARRGKPSFGVQVSDLERARRNLLARDSLLAQYIRDQARQYGYALYEVDGTQLVDEMAALIAQQFAPFLLM